MSTFDPGKPVDYPLPATRQTITPEAVARGAAALDQAFPALGQDFTPAWFVKAAGLVLEAALGMPAPPEVLDEGEARARFTEFDGNPPLTGAPWADDAGAGAIALDGHVELELRDGTPLWVNPDYVVSVTGAGVTYSADDDGPLCAVQLAFTQQAWLVRGEPAFVAEQVWP